MARLRVVSWEKLDRATNRGSPHTDREYTRFPQPVERQRLHASRDRKLSPIGLLDLVPDAFPPRCLGKPADGDPRAPDPSLSYVRRPRAFPFDSPALPPALAGPRASPGLHVVSAYLASPSRSVTLRSFHPHSIPRLSRKNAYTAHTHKKRMSAERTRGDPALGAERRTSLPPTLHRATNRLIRRPPTTGLPSRPADRGVELSAGLVNVHADRLRRGK